jgi:hypothetical protein
MSDVVALSTLAGPLLSGAINNTSTWRWIFMLKYLKTLPESLKSHVLIYCAVPSRVITVVLLTLTIPANFQYHGQPNFDPQPILSTSILRRVDFHGASLMLAASLLLVTPLLGVGGQF